MPDGCKRYFSLLLLLIITLYSFSLFIDRFIAYKRISVSLLMFFFIYIITNLSNFVSVGDGKRRIDRKIVYNQ